MTTQKAAWPSPELHKAPTQPVLTSELHHALGHNRIRRLPQHRQAPVTADHGPSQPQKHGTQ
jgi:hypothetical protein